MREKFKREFKAGLKGYMLVCSTVIALPFIWSAVETSNIKGWQYVWVSALAVLGVLMAAFIIFVSICFLNALFEKVKIDVCKTEAIKELHDIADRMEMYLEKYIEAQSKNNETISLLCEAEVGSSYYILRKKIKGLMTLTGNSEGLCIKNWTKNDSQYLEGLNKLLNKMEEKYKFLPKI